MASQDSRKLTSSPERLAANGADSAQIAASIGSFWSEIEVALVPIIGQRGVAALYERSLFLTRVQHTWLAAVPESADTLMDLPALRAVLVRQDSASAAAGGVAHLQALQQLLGTLIGPSLAERLLRSTWANAYIASPAQDPSHE